MFSEKSIAIFMGFVGILFFGGSIISWLNENCPDISLQNCQFLSGMAIFSALGGILLFEMIVVYQKARGRWGVPQEDTHDNEPIMTFKHHLIRSIGWVTISGLLAGLPLVTKGAIAISIFAPLTGILIAFWVRAIGEWIPSLEE